MTTTTTTTTTTPSSARSLWTKPRMKPEMEHSAIEDQKSDFCYCAQTEFYRPSKCSQHGAELLISKDTIEKPLSYRSLFDSYDPPGKLPKLKGLLKKRVQDKYRANRDVVSVRSVKATDKGNLARLWSTLRKILTMGRQSERNEPEKVENIVVQVDWYAHDSSTDYFRTPPTSQHPIPEVFRLMRSGQIAPVVWCLLFSRFQSAWHRKSGAWCLRFGSLPFSPLRYFFFSLSERFQLVWA